MPNYIEKALKTVLQEKRDVAENKAGRYHVWMKWDGYSAMVNINYLQLDGEHDFQICRWDLLDKRIDIYSVHMLRGSKRKKLLMAIRAIRNLGYELKEFNLHQSRSGNQSYVDNVTEQFERYIA